MQRIIWVSYMLDLEMSHRHWHGYIWHNCIWDHSRCYIRLNFQNTKYISFSGYSCALNNGTGSVRCCLTRWYPVTLCGSIEWMWLAHGMACRLLWLQTTTWVSFFSSGGYFGVIYIEVHIFSIDACIRMMHKNQTFYQACFVCSLHNQDRLQFMCSLALHKYTFQTYAERSQAMYSD